MTKPTQDRAGRFLKEVMETIPDDPPKEKVFDILLRCSELADRDLAECRTNQQKQTVWAALLTAVQLAIRSRSGDATAVSTLREALIDTSLGRPGDHGLTSPAIPNTISSEVEWMRACMIALLDEYPETRQQTYKDAAHLLDVSEKSLKRVCENYKGGKIGGDVFKDLVRTAKEIINELCA